MSRRQDSEPTPACRVYPESLVPLDQLPPHPPKGVLDLLQSAHADHLRTSRSMSSTNSSTRISTPDWSSHWRCCRQFPAGEAWRRGVPTLDNGSWGWHFGAVLHEVYETTPTLWRPGSGRTCGGVFR